MAFELVQNNMNNVKDVIKDIQLLNVHKWRTNAPWVPEIAVVLSGMKQCILEILLLKINITSLYLVLLSLCDS